METILKEINAVVGVTGTFVCGTDGDVIARAVPDGFSAVELGLASRIVGQTFQALEGSGQRLNDVDLTYDKGRLVLKNLDGGILAILCARNINLPLLNLTANRAVKKLAVELKPGKMPVSEPVAPTVVALPSFGAELEQEVFRIVEEGKHYRLRLRALGTTAAWMACPQHRALLPPLETKQIEFGGFQNDVDSIELLYQQLGYQNNRRYSSFYSNRRLNFIDPKRDINVQVFLDSYDMFHRLDLIPFLTQEDILLPVTALLLTRLQLVETNDKALREIAVLLLEHDLSIGAEKGKVDAAHITRLAADDWGWFKTISMNLDRAATFATNNFPASEHSIIVERAQRLKHSMDGTPKSLRWQARSRLGESAKWYEIPLIYKPSSARPDMAIG